MGAAEILGVPSLELCYSERCLCWDRALSLCLSLRLRKIPVTGFKPILIHSYLFHMSIKSAKILFPKKAHSEVLGECEFRRDKIHTQSTV